MSFEYKTLNIEKLSIIGAGQIGPDIALHFSKVLSGHGVQIVLVDIAQEALDRAKAKIEKKIAKGEETGAFKPDKARQMREAFRYTTDYAAISGSAIVLEAATENEAVKDKIFRQVKVLCDDQCLFFSNSSHMQPEVIFKNIRNKSRCLVTHYFFPAERNPIVEIVPGKDTDESVVRLLIGFYETIGKIPIRVSSSYGYAIDPIFEGLCQTAILCLEKGYGTVKEIDKVASATLGLGVGPFTALNLTGGNPITNHGLDEMHKLVNPWFRSPDLLHEAVVNGTFWPTAKREEDVVVDSVKEQKLAAIFRGAYFALASFIMDLGICDLNDLNMATEIALVARAPFTMMNRMGIGKAYEAVEAFCREYPEFPFPESLKKARQAGGWDLHDIIRQDDGGIAVLTIRRPKYLNALNEGVIAELKQHLENIEKDPEISGAVITGYGQKAFVSGADINMLARLKTPEDAYENSQTFHRVLNYLEGMKKPVACALNGIAFGGGNELAMACHYRISRKGLRTLAAQPEVRLGIIPGAGGTQRLPRLVGIEKASEILRTGQPVSSAEALQIGLIDEEVEGDLLPRAEEVVRELADGKRKRSLAPREPMKAPEKLPAVELGFLSRKIDEILTRAILEGAAMTLEEGLQLESRLFAECMKTEDMKIGLETFRKEGPKARAAFVHR